MGNNDLQATRSQLLNSWYVRWLSYGVEVETRRAGYANEVMQHKILVLFSFSGTTMTSS
jgi:hypothetical protein